MNCSRCAGLLLRDDGELKCVSCSRAVVSEAELALRAWVLEQDEFVRKQGKSRKRQPSYRGMSF